MNVLNTLRQTRTANQNPLQWYADNAKRLKRIKPRHLMRGSNLSSSISIGGMYLFSYNPKTKAKLPYYDRFPLAIPIEPYSNGFLGLNLHYLKPQYRVVILKALTNVTSTQKLNANIIKKK